MYIASRLSDYNPDYNPVSAGSDSKANATCISEYESLNLGTFMM